MFNLTVCLNINVAFRLNSIKFDWNYKINFFLVLFSNEICTVFFIFNLNKMS